MGLLIAVTFTYITVSVLLGSKVFCFYCLFAIVVIAVAILLDIACIFFLSYLFMKSTLCEFIN